MEGLLFGLSMGLSKQECEDFEQNENADACEEYLENHVAATESSCKCACEATSFFISAFR